LVKFFSKTKTHQSESIRGLVEIQHKTSSTGYS